MVMPNFLIMGTMKAGTTSLYNYVKQHPQIYMSPIKAPDFFALEGRKWDFGAVDGSAALRPWTKANHAIKATDIEDYRALFQGVSDETAIGEASPSYLYRPDALSRIKHYIPEAKMIAILRNPVDRAYSAYNYARKTGQEPLDDFAQALRAEEERVRNDSEWVFHYKSFGFYCTQLKRYYEAFERKQIRVYLYEDLKDDPIGLVQDVFRYLEVDDTFTPDTSSTFNVGRVPKGKVLYQLVVKPNRAKTVAKSLLPKTWRGPIKERVQRLSLTKVPPLRKEVRSELIEVYREDILGLQELIQRDLSGWLPDERSPDRKGERVLNS